MYSLRSDWPGHGPLVTTKICPDIELAEKHNLSRIWSEQAVILENWMLKTQPDCRLVNAMGSDDILLLINYRELCLFSNSTLL
jgi:hypothetical protein